MEYTTNYALSEPHEHSRNSFFDSLPSAWTLFAFLSLAYITLSVVSYFLILTDTVYVHSMEQKLTAERIEEALAMRSEYWWSLAVLPPILLSIRAAFTAICCSVGVIMIGQDISYGKVFKIALAAEVIFLLAMAVQVGWGLFVLNVYVPEDYTDFAPLSLLQFFDPASLKLWMKHPLRTLNLFEVAYCFVLAYFLKPLLKKRDFMQTLGLVSASYGLGLLLWVVALAFLLLQVS
ncbi:MAG: hypothetical protein EAZ92_01140 [Candidatus Kapaibacterium sp.]|nr:MAG: hypothetical protein EAZ92_01140 [Candidatus Kapabacteria bacterium]